MAVGAHGVDLTGRNCIAMTPSTTAQGTTAGGTPVGNDTQATTLARLAGERAAGGNQAFDILLRTPLQVSIRFGTARLTLGEVLELKENSVVELDRAADGVVEILLNQSVVATGEVVTVDGRYGVRILDVTGWAAQAGTETGSSTLAMAAAVNRGGLGTAGGNTK
jgi:flagellar motor switch protein FliN/FliY